MQGPPAVAAGASREPAASGAARSGQGGRQVRAKFMDAMLGSASEEEEEEDSDGVGDAHG